jgi:hypothetical protein
MRRCVSFITFHFWDIRAKRDQRERERELSVFRTNSAYESWHLLRWPRPACPRGTNSARECGFVRLCRFEYAPMRLGFGVCSPLTLHLLFVTRHVPHVGRCIRGERRCECVCTEKPPRGQPPKQPYSGHSNGLCQIYFHSNKHKVMREKKKEKKKPSPRHARFFCSQVDCRRSRMADRCFPWLPRERQSARRAAPPWALANQRPEKDRTAPLVWVPHGTPRIVVHLSLPSPNQGRHRVRRRLHHI